MICAGPSRCHGSARRSVGAGDGGPSAAPVGSWRRAFGWGVEGAAHIGVDNICQTSHDRLVSTMNISLPEALKAFVDEQVRDGSYGTSSEYIRELIRKDQERRALRGLLLEGASSPATPAVDAAYFAGLREQIRGANGRRARR